MSVQAEVLSIGLEANPNIWPLFKYMAKNLAMGNHIPESKQSLMNKALDQALDVLMEGKNAVTRRVKIDFAQEKHKFVIKIENNGYPPLYEWEDNIYEKISPYCDRVQYVNHGRQGQMILIEYQHNVPPRKKEQTNDHLPIGPLVYQPMRREDCKKLSKLFYSVYGNNYIDEKVYFPKHLEDSIQKQTMRSMVAKSKDGQLLGHVGLVKIHEDPDVYEASLGVVDPTIKSKGVFKGLFSKIMTMVENTPMKYCLYDLVTNHEFSQKEVFKYPACVLSAHIGCQISETQAKLESLGLGKDAEDMDRYSILMAIRSQVNHPFGSEVVLPVHLGEKLEFLLSPLNMKWIPASRFFPLRLEGRFSFEVNTVQKAMTFFFDVPARNILKQVEEMWKDHLKRGIQYCAIDIPLDYPGTSQVYDYFAQRGFFLSGLIPYKKSATLALRIQCLGPTRVAWDDIKIVPEAGKKLLEIVFEDYQRNAFI